MTIARILRAGLLSTVQDLGRPNYRQFGVTLGGAMDRLSHELANRLVGNKSSAATLEMTLSGDELEFTEPVVIAIAGGEFSPTVTIADNSAPIRVPQHAPIHLSARARLRIHTATRGCRCYLAVAGGFEVPEVLGSRSTLIRTQLGGLEGRALRSGDELSIGPRDAAAETAFDEWTSADESGVMVPRWFVRLLDFPSGDTVALRVIRGEHFAMISSSSQARFWEQGFLVKPQSDRMGYRLAAEALVLENTRDMLSEGTTVGTLQLPPDGQPILLMADSAPTGGYRRIAHVISADLPRAAQVRPGQSIRFVETTLEKARSLFQQQRADLDRAMTMVGLTSGAKSGVPSRCDKRSVQ